MPSAAPHPEDVSKQFTMRRCHSNSNPEFSFDGFIRAGFSVFASTLKSFERAFGLLKWVFLGLALALLCACGKVEERPLQIALNAWPGYEFLYLAEQKGFFKEQGLNIDIVELDSLSDAQRAYIHGRVDGFASTMVEAVQSQMLSNRPLKVILVTDYSNGGDVIVARKEISNLLQLKHKRVGCEVSSLGIYILHRALQQIGLSINDVQVLNVEQGKGIAAMNNGEIDAFVTYPPVSIELLKNLENVKIFSTTDIPYEIMDVLSVSQELIDTYPDFVGKIHRVWQKTLNFTQHNQQEAYALMAQREGLSVEEFKAVLDEIVVLNEKDQVEIFRSPQRLQAQFKNACEILVAAQSMLAQCDKLPSMVDRLQR